MFFNDFDLGKIPVVAVFTHFDALEEQFYVKLAKQHQRQHPRTPLPQDIIRQANAYAVKEYDEVHRRNLEKILGSHSEVGIQRVSMPPDDEAGADGNPIGPWCRYFDGISCPCIDQTIQQIQKVSTT